jgi:hypothetical protein
MPRPDATTPHIADVKKRSIYKTDPLPIGFPHKLYMYSFIMWTMWSVAMMLKSIGLTWQICQANRHAAYASFRAAFWPLPVSDEPSYRTREPRPGESKPRGRKRNGSTMNMILGLMVAMDIAKSMPTVQVASKTEFCRDIRKRYRTKGGLKLCKMSPVELENLRDVLRELPTELVAKEQMKPIIIDTGASRTASGCREDFVKGTLKKLDNPLALDGVGGGVVGTHIGIARYEVLSDLGTIAVIECSGLYVPSLGNVRLYSPQTHFAEVQAALVAQGKGGGEAGDLSIKWDSICLVLPKQDPITLEYDVMTRLPVMQGFADVDQTAASLAIMGCVTAEGNQNLTYLQKVLLQWHIRLGHVGFGAIKWAARNGWLGSPSQKVGSDSVKLPKCAACSYGKQQRTPKAGSTSTPERQGCLKNDKLNPGDLVFTDQFESRLPGRVFSLRGNAVTSKRYKGGIVFIDAASGAVRVYMCEGFTAAEAVQAKLQYEREALECGVAVKNYQSDNGVYTSREWTVEIHEKGQGLKLSGVGGHHHNGVAENGIKHIVRSARTMMIHSALRWTEQANRDLWPLAIKQAVHLYNETPAVNMEFSPEEMWTKSRSSHSALLSAHTWGCPTYVLQPKLQDGMKLPKWQPRSRQGLYLGASDRHASTVGLILNLRTKNISPQFHCVYDDYFETVFASPEDEPKVWKELLIFQTYNSVSDVDDEDYVPELSDEWLSDEEIQERLPTAGPIPEVREARTQGRSGSAQNPVTVDDEDDDNEGGLQEGELPISENGEPPRSEERELPERRTRSAPDRYSDEKQNKRPQSGGNSYGFNKRRGLGKLKVGGQYTMAVIKATRDRLYSALRLKRPSHMGYIYALMMDPEYGVMHDILPNSISRPGFLKAAKNDPDSPRLDQAMMGPHREEYVEAMVKEIGDLERHGTWTVVKRSSVPEGKKVLPSTWALKLKRYPDGRPRKFKARFCVRGDFQEEGVDYFESYSPVVQWSTVRLLLTLSVHEDWSCRQIDFSNAFVQATLDEETYVSLPRMFYDDEQGKDSCLKLNKSLYGICQAPLAWFRHLTAALKMLGLEASEHDPCVFYRESLVVLCYVDDCLIFSPDQSKIDEFIQELRDAKFELTVEGENGNMDVYAFLGVDVKPGEDGTKVLTQKGLTDKLLKYCHMEDCNAKGTPASPTPLSTDANGKMFDEEWEYASAVGMAMYLSSNSRPDIQFAVHQCARFTHCPKASHGEALKRICRYLQGTSSKGLIIDPKSDLTLDLYADADFAGLYNHESDQDPVCVKSRSGYIITLGGAPLIWGSKLQTEIALSTLESEYICLSQAVRELLPMRRLLLEVGQRVNMDFAKLPMVRSTVFEDNNGALGLANSPKITPRTRHIATKYHWFRDLVGEDIEIVKVDTKEQKADGFTKGLAEVPFKAIRKLVMGW